jgi:hypothetical protein
MPYISPAMVGRATMISRYWRRVWFHEIRNFLFRDKRLKNGPVLTEFWGAPQDDQEEAMRLAAASRPAERNDGRFPPGEPPGQPVPPRYNPAPAPPSLRAGAELV